jgi:hypothetical protein
MGCFSYSRVAIPIISLETKTVNICCEKHLAEAAKRLPIAGMYIQGFHYGRFFIIRDLRKKPGSDQEIWRCSDDNRQAFELQIEIERLRFVLESQPAGTVARGEG